MAYRLIASSAAGERPVGEAFERPIAFRMADQLVRTDTGQEGIVTYRVVDWREKVIYEIANDGQPGREIR